MNKILDVINLKNKKVLFIAETHFQIINCINIAFNSSCSECDLYINKIYKDSEYYAKRIEKSKIFRDVVTYDLKFGSIKKTWRFLNLKSYVLDKFKKFDYDFVFFASRDFLARCVVAYCKYHRKTIKVISYDEGLGSYITRMEEYTNNIEKCIVKLFYHDSPNLITDKILYKPEAYIGKANNITLYRMPIWNNALIQLLNRIYGYNDYMNMDSDIIYFDNYFNEKDTNKNNIVEYLAARYNVIIKKHPQTPNGAYKSCSVYQFPQLPYELLAANDKDISDKILITIMSTSVWTPFLILNKYPKIILLYPLINSVPVNDARNIIEKMISLYPKNKILIIRNMSELENIELDDK